MNPQVIWILLTTFASLLSALVANALTIARMRTTLVSKDSLEKEINELKAWTKTRVGHCNDAFDNNMRQNSIALNYKINNEFKAIRLGIGLIIEHMPIDVEKQDQIRKQWNTMRETLLNGN